MRAALLLASALAIAGCAAEAQRGEESAEAGPATARDFAVAEFDRIALGGPHDVVVRVGPAASVRAEGSADALERLEIEAEGGELKIGNKRDGWFSGRKARTATVYVTVPRLAGAAIGGSGDMRIDRVEGDRFAGAIGGSGDMAIDRLSVEEADFSVAGSGGIRAAGRAARSKVSIAGSGDVDLSGVDTRIADVSIVGSGDVRARASETAMVSIMGSGDVTVDGTARCTIRKMGSGEVRCGA